MKKGVIAVFDFDGTLIRKDSFIEFAKYSVGKKKLLTEIIRNSIRLMAWKLKLIAGGMAKQSLFSSLFKGMPLSVFQKYSDGFAEVIGGMENKEIVDKLSYHIGAGHKVYIISASVPNWIKPWGRKHGLPEDSVLGTDVEINDKGNLSGKFSNPNCNGDEKLRRFKELFPDTENYDIFVYGDSGGDEVIMSIADHKEWV